MVNALTAAESQSLIWVITIAFQILFMVICQVAIIMSSNAVIAA